MANSYDPDNTGDPAVIAANQDAKHATALEKWRESLIPIKKNNDLVVASGGLFGEGLQQYPVKPRHPDPSKR